MRSKTPCPDKLTPQQVLDTLNPNSDAVVLDKEGSRWYTHSLWNTAAGILSRPRFSVPPYARSKKDAIEYLRNLGQAVYEETRDGDFALLARPHWDVTSNMKA